MKPIFKIKIWKFLVLILTISISFCFLNLQNTHSESPQEVLIKLKNSESIYKIKLDSNSSKDRVKKEFLKNKNVELISDNNSYNISILPNDFSFPLQSYLKQSRIDLSWTFSRDLDNITIAIIDTGVDLNHPDLAENIWKNKDEIEDDGIDNDQNGYIDDVYGWDFVNNNSDNNVKISLGYKKYAVNHGTVVAGIASAKSNNNEGITGAAWGAKIMSLRALDSRGRGNTYNIARAINYAVKNGADIINLSFVGKKNDEILSNSIRNAYKAGVAVVAAAGNESSISVDMDKSPRYPVCNDFNKNTVFGVASVDEFNKVSKFSNYGEKCIDILAPGENMFSTQVYQPAIRYFKNKYGGKWSGTSFSAPLVSATIALIKGVDPNFSLPEIYKIIQDSAQNVSFKNFSKRNQIGAGVLDAHAAVILARQIKRNKQISIISIPESAYNLKAKIFNQKTKKISEVSLKKDYKTYKYNLESGDLDGDKKSEIIISKTNYQGTTISIYDQEFKFLNEFKLDYKKPISLTISDLYSNGRDKIIVGSPNGYKPEVSIYDMTGNLLNKFLVYNEKFLGGVSLTSCDVDKDYDNEIIVAAGKGGGPHIRIFNKNGGLKGQFFSEDKSFRGGLNIDCADLNNDKKGEIITSKISQDSSEIKTYDLNGNLISSFSAYDKKFDKEVKVKIANVSSNYSKEIITFTGNGSNSKIKIFTKEGELLEEFFAYEKNNLQGINLTTLIKNEI